MWTTLRGASRARLLQDLVDCATISAGRRYVASSSLAVQPPPPSRSPAAATNLRRKRSSPKGLLRQTTRGPDGPAAAAPPPRDSSAVVIGAAVPDDAVEGLEDDLATDVDLQPTEPQLFSTPWRSDDSRPIVRPPLAPADARRRGHFGTFAEGYVTAGALNTLHHLSVALATGQTSRAKSIFYNVEESLGYRRLSNARNAAGSRVDRDDGDHAPLRDVVPAALHAGFVRRYYADALKAQEENRLEDQRRAENEAYEWLQNLRYNGKDWGEVDHHVIAAAIKGVLQLREPYYNVLDLMPWILPSNARLARRTESPTLANVLASLIFTTSHPAYLGDLSASSALERIRAAAEAAGRMDVLIEVEAASEALRSSAASSTDERSVQDRSEGSSRDAHDRPDVPSLDPVRQPPRLNNFGTGDRSVPLRLGHLLSNVGTIPDSARHVSDAYDRQLLLENAGYDAAQAEWYDLAKAQAEQGVNNDPTLNSRQLQRWMWDWHKALVKRLEDLRVEPSGEIDSDQETDRVQLGLLPSEVLSKVVIIEVLRSMGHRAIADGAKSTSLFVEVGKAIESEWRAYLLQETPSLKWRMVSAIRKARKSVGGARGDFLAVRSLWRRSSEVLAKEQRLVDVHDWSLAQKGRVGALAVKCLMAVATIKRTHKSKDGMEQNEDQPAFYSSFQYLEGHRIGVVKINDEVASRLDRDPANITLHPRYLPMLAPPLPWTEPSGGAYLVHGAPFMRIADSVEQLLHVQEAHKAGSLESIFRALDKLGNTAWVINRPIFETMSQVWNSGLALAGIPVRDPHVHITDPAVEHLDGVASHESVESALPSDPLSDTTERVIYRALLTARRTAYSQRCTVNYQLEIARAFVDEIFFFPHNLDFRGRAYPIPANLNHIGDDISRGLLTFAEKRRLGATGLRWLKIHLSNKAGNDKASLDDRAAFAEANMDSVFDSADRPLDGDRWWLKSDDPWQTLAACIELASAMRSSDPEAYESSLPVHQDGSCNGLQHYAALGGDVEGGREVNLVKGDRPGDVYSKVAAEVNKLVDRDAAAGHELALAVQGKVSRKVVKQTVMTTVYGVTFVGARDQIKRQLKDLQIVPIPLQFVSSAYLANLVLRSIGEVFSGATAIQRWLTHVARLVAKSVPPERLKTNDDEEVDGDQLMTSMTWTTPLGLVACQPYRKHDKSQIKTVMQSIYLHDPGSPGQADSRGQASAFPPNFIHSLDATHMMLTALSCEDIDFAAVHDSFWTHAADIPTLNARLRDAFVKLHETNILENLAEELRHRFAGHVVPRSALTRTSLADLENLGVQVPAGRGPIPLNDLIPPIPPRGSLDVRSVQESSYFFS